MGCQCGRDTESVSSGRPLKIDGRRGGAVTSFYQGVPENRNIHNCCHLSAASLRARITGHRCGGLLPGEVLLGC